MTSFLHVVGFSLLNSENVFLFLNAEYRRSRLNKTLYHVISKISNLFSQIKRTTIEILFENQNICLQEKVKTQTPSSLVILK